VRGSPRFDVQHARSKQRADAILDALYDDRADEGMSSTVLASAAP
jgi:hypothetical protein